MITFLKHNLAYLYEGFDHTSSLQVLRAQTLTGKYLARQSAEWASLRFKVRSLTSTSCMWDFLVHVCVLSMTLFANRTRVSVIKVCEDLFESHMNNASNLPRNQNLVL